MADKSPVKLNKEHGGKEFTGSFHFVGKVKPVRTQEEGSDSWVDVPYYREETDDYGKPKKVLEFIIETAESNDIKVKMTGKEMQYVYPFSSTKRSATKVAWNDRNDKTKYPDDTYHLIDPEWDKIDKYKELIVTDTWLEVKGKYNPYEFTGRDSNIIKGVLRSINFINPVIDGKVKIGEEMKPIQVNKKDIPYVCNLKSPDFVEVNNFKLQIGINSVYEDEKNGVVQVNGIYLDYGKQRSVPKPIELVVYQTEAVEGKKSLADAFATLEQLDFIEVTGQDNNRATFAYVPVEEKLDLNDPFAEVDDSKKQVKMEKVTNGAKKGLEITGYVAGSLIRGFLTEEEITKEVDVFASDSPPVDISENEDPFAS